MNTQRWGTGPFDNTDALGILAWLIDLEPARSPILLSHALKRLSGRPTTEMLDEWTANEGIAAAVLVSILVGGPAAEQPYITNWCANVNLDAWRTRDLVLHARKAIWRAAHEIRNNEWATALMIEGTFLKTTSELGPWRGHLASRCSA